MSGNRIPARTLPSRVHRGYAEAERLAHLGRLDAHNPLVPISTEVQMVRAERLTRQLEARNRGPSRTLRAS